MLIYYYLPLGTVPKESKYTMGLSAHQRLLGIVCKLHIAIPPLILDGQNQHDPENGVPWLTIFSRRYGNTVNKV